MDKIADLLEKLATKLGTTVEYLWPLLVRKTQVDWIAETAVWVFFALAAITGAILWYRAAERWRLEAKLAEWSEGHVFVMGAACVIGVVCTAAVAMQFGSISQFLCPEAATITNLLRAVK